MTLFARLQAQFDGLRAVDAAFAEMLQRLDPQTDPQVLTGAALASWAVGAGHAAFDPARPQLLTSAVDGWPDAPSWSEALQSSPWVGVPNADEVAPDCVPLVFENGLLYLRRYREYERRLAAGLRRIAAYEPPTSDPDAMAPLFAALFPEARAGDRQARAAALSLLRSLLLITGGPGTGKTATIARLLLLLIADGQRAGSAPLRIALAAPTGRAAERMAESLRLAAAQLHAATDIDRAGCDALPVSASTVHRLLGAIPGNPQFRHRADHPLPYDV
ncbi:MAG: AAA family ATPase, partial [Luteimonas sp.]